MSDNGSAMLSVLLSAQGHAQAGRFAAAIELLEGIPATVENAPEVVYLLASMYIQSQRWSCAEPLLAKLLEVNPGRAVLVFDRATCLIELGRVVQATELLNDPSPEVRNRYPRLVLLARIAVHAGDMNLGAERLADALQDGPAAFEMAGDFADLSPLVTSLARSLAVDADHSMDFMEPPVDQCRVVRSQPHNSTQSKGDYL